MKKLILASALMLVMVAPAFAEDAPKDKAPSELQQLEFKNHKDEMMSMFAHRISEMQAHMAEMQTHISEMQQKQTCVQAAADQEALHACMPKMGEGHEGGGEHHDMQGQGMHDMPPPGQEKK